MMVASSPTPARTIIDNETGKEIQVRKRKMYFVLDALVRNAMNGDNVAIAQIIDRVQGKPQQEVCVDTTLAVALNHAMENVTLAEATQMYEASLKQGLPLMIDGDFNVLDEAAVAVEENALAK
jgi:recombinational DNA repair protein RecR